MALAPKSKSPALVASSSSVLSDMPSVSPSSSSSSSFDISPVHSNVSSLNNLHLLPDETVQHSVPCSFVFPETLTLPVLPGTLYITTFRLRFEPQSASLRGNGNFHRLLDTALQGMPRAAVAKLSYPQATVSTMNAYTGATPTRLVIKFKDLRAWTLGGDVTRLLPAINRYAFVESPLRLFAFMSTFPKDSLHGHALYNLDDDFARMGITLRNGSSAYRVTNLNASFVMCPTYPQELVVPTAATDTEVGAVASFRSKGRLPICSYVHAQNGAALWRCAQPKRGILHAQNQSDEQYLLHIARASSPTGNPNTRRIWIADCRPELNARVNNLTGGGTERGNLAHARVTFLNIGNIHAMRESMEAVRTLGGFEASSTITEPTDLAWGTRVEDTKWLLHVRRVLSGALQVARALDSQATTVVVHCSDGWDRTAQLCALAQLLVDAHYRSRRGFLEVIEKEWVRAGHKFQERVAPGKSEDDDDQQAPIFLQFLDCVWQLLRLYPTYFEFNERMLEAMADALFSGRYGTFLGDCERERMAWRVRERTPSLYTYLLQSDRFVNPFYRGSSTDALLPDPPTLLRQVALWTSYYFRGAPFPSTPPGNPTPPTYATNDLGDDNVPSSHAQEDLENAMTAALRRIRELEDALRVATSEPSPLRPAPMSYPPLYAPTAEPDQTAYRHNSNGSSYSNCSKESVHADQPTTLPPSAPVQPLSTWTCSLCTKTNMADVLQCVVCGRTPR
ncbi:myotubularin-related protein 2-like isoform x3 [Plasmopara halstedii]|uniref:Myotubularin-related protein 2-like isoform x3 n=1 Tax=Plasmopara halstedii TaxID=4781 RepID=A0A0P1A8I6_PLAHL|nr:myotubularin-related protein 2-like isoform x3 [Plasmopara halstedii]CEG36602.1 myotubularin-related protein 2-like isoform x3 [Plasmopara halstedii]|eukprot:XP_024572971.1 myotubularin-related protein 2-like isoform x3 [Plasmopara halstedii]